MTQLLNRRNLIILVALLAFVTLAGILAWTAARGGKANIDGDTVQRIVAADVLAVLSEELGVDEDEATNLYEQKLLGETAENQDLTRSDLMQSIREALVASLQEAVDRGEITSEQAEQALQMAARAVSNHL